MQLLWYVCVFVFFFLHLIILSISFYQSWILLDIKKTECLNINFLLLRVFFLIKELKFYLCGLHINISICVICKSMLKISLLFLLSDLALIQSLLVIYISSLVHFNECVPNACRLLDICTIYKYYKYSLDETYQTKVFLINSKGVKRLYWNKIETHKKILTCPQSL